MTKKKRIIVSEFLFKKKESRTISACPIKIYTKYKYNQQNEIRVKKINFKKLNTSAQVLGLAL